MNTKLHLTVVISLIIGIGAGYLLGLHTMPPSHMQAARGMQDQMDSMVGSLTGKTGDAFDQAFLSEMIMHHQGAVQMAELARTNANHAEIKQMAEDIISAQTKEIQMMQGWQTTWYGSAPAVHHAN